MDKEKEAIKIAILNCNKQIEKLEKEIIKLRTANIFMLHCLSSFIGTENAKEFLSFLEVTE